MTEPPLRSSRVDLFEAHRIRFVEGAGPRLSAADQLAMNRVWDEAVQANSSLFDGPAVACTGLNWEEQAGTLVLSWARSTYRCRALRRVPGAPSVSSVFVCVLQAADDGRLLVGRMSSSTAAPGRWQLPGGSMEPPHHGQPLDVAALRDHAARELLEETGVDTPPTDLTLWLITRGEHGNVGFVFLAPGRPAELLHERFAALVASETALGRDSELDRIALIRSGTELAELGGPRVDYLDPVVRRYVETACSPTGS
ncbi:NUDIX hydrolase [Streptomyces syringium]|uniref:8-oxo-dGTP pyrophosphatase MutT (NUDIX family) n=1 Tax=Streptomyces syringium TaxID=76729 RepID=A0ABS4XVP4_9ACTN|nr:NUDIX domain-containing protein [Streptomyces syringium]MBP2400578.1 8-oxo-dGTP pyrophosphatase MutT (NUDIX family) [Streptomyces syringium]